ncbi:MAG: helix-hairpin-helix domain-containing protein [Melioribacteraceae bacterium]|nr:helix-hairpin-helix domain-containing protein [Melioribacteraceae bacterium]
MKYNDEVEFQKEFDYSQQDSLFWNNLTSEQNRNSAKKKVDYEQELYDFSGNELKSVLTKININNASVEELKTLPGIGVKTAEKIILYRNNYGKFRTINDLIKVSGIGEKKLEKIKNYILIE